MFFRLLIKSVVITFLFTACLVGANVNAKEVEQLNEITTLVEDQTRSTRTKAIDMAFEQVLVRYTGLTPENISSTVKSNRINATNYLQRFQYQEATLTQQPAELSETLFDLVLVFDPVAITNLLTQLNLPQWSNNRPDMLMWIAIGDKTFRLLLGTDHQLRLKELLTRFANNPFTSIQGESRPPASSDVDDTEMMDPIDQLYLEKIGTDEDLLLQIKDLASLRGMPVILPLLDLQDNVSLDSADVWGQFVTQIRSASERYQPDLILVGKIELVQEGWLTDWLIIGDTASDIWQGSAQTLSSALDQGIEQAIVRTAERFAVVQDTSSSQFVEISVSGIGSTTAMAELEAYLQSQTAIADIYVSRLMGNEIRYRISLITDIPGLLQSIRLEQRLVETEPVSLTINPAEAILPQPVVYFEWNG